MKKLLILVLSSLLLAGCKPKELFLKPLSGLEINTTPSATVFLNGENKGETPYSDKNLKPGSYTLKLVPGSSSSFPPFETNLNLAPKVTTVVSRNFSQDDLDSFGYTLQLQEENSGSTYISVISEPDTINVTLDGKPSGFTPLSKLPIDPGTHSLIVTSPGYIEQTLSVVTIKGYNLIVNFKLASQTITLSPSSPSTPSASLAPTPTPATSSAIITPKPYIVIGETGTGWLRIRKEAAGTSEELGKANTGEKLKYLGESTDLGWHKVEFEGAIGWVSGKYVTLVK